MQPLGTIRVGSQNVERLGFQATGQGKDKQHVETESSVKVQQTIAEGLKKADLDVVMLQEVPSAESLENFVSKQGLKEKFPHAQFFKGGSKDTHMAVLSRHELEVGELHGPKSKSDRNEHNQPIFARSFPEVQVKMKKLPTTRFVVYPMHLKADANPALRESEPELYDKIQLKAETKRQQEAEQISKIVKDDLKQFPNTVFVIGGDGNESPYRKLTSDSPETRQTGEARSSAIPVMKEQLGVTDAFQSLEQEAITHPDQQEQLDWLLASPGLKSVPGKAQVFEHDQSVGPDHRLIVNEYFIADSTSR